MGWDVYYRLSWRSDECIECIAHCEENCHAARRSCQSLLNLPHRLVSRQSWHRRIRKGCLPVGDAVRSDSPCDLWCVSYGAGGGRALDVANRQQRKVPRARSPRTIQGREDRIVWNLDLQRQACTADAPLAPLGDDIPDEKGVSGREGAGRALESSRSSTREGASGHIGQGSTIRGSDCPKPSSLSHLTTFHRTLSQNTSFINNGSYIRLE